MDKTISQREDINIDEVKLPPKISNKIKLFKSRDTREYSPGYVPIKRFNHKYKGIASNSMLKMEI